MLTSLESTICVSTESCGDISQMARRAAEEQRARWASLRVESNQIRQSIVQAEHSLRTPWKLHQRRMLGEARLVKLKQVKAQVDAVHREVVGARHQAESFELIARPGDRRLADLRAEHRRCQAVLEALRSRCGELAALMTELSQWPPSARLSPADGATGACIFPEMPMRAHRILDPMSAREELSPEDQARFDIELLLRRAGLLVFNQSYDASYTDITSIAAGKPNVKRATVRGSDRVKVLKEYSLADFRSIERAISTSRWLSHPGLVPVECAFVERFDLVVVQMPWFAGGNMRDWCWRHRADLSARVRAAAKIAEAVRFLHAHDEMHRDLKPENVVVDGVGADAAPAVCDFDLSVNQASVGATRVRGTLLYLAPDDTPSKASDIFSLGMLLLDVLFCAGDDAKLTSWLGHTGRFGIDEPSLEKLRSDLRRATAQDPEVAARLGAVSEGIPQLIGEMIRSDCRERPVAAAVAVRLCEILDSAGLLSLLHRLCSHANRHRVFPRALHVPALLLAARLLPGVAVHRRRGGHPAEQRQVRHGLRQGRVQGHLHPAADGGVRHLARL
jgi:tRNA A-37 threonylcarbamoyl transferase component Bud32